MVGRTLGHYHLVETLGQGGMGTVYKGRDTRLGRLVAIKLLHTGSAPDADRKRRFVQEAKAASALNHANIVAVYDIASEDGADFIVMEYVPGSTLGTLIPPSGFPVMTSLKFAEQIARAVAAAHAAGIIHRDLKPGNIVVTPAHEIKVLDFGLAKLTRAGTAHHEDTATKPLTETGMVMGTVQYMSPEQAVGRPVDHRTDIFSLGVILYEMLSGKKPFTGEHTAAVVHAIYYHPHTPLARADLPEAAVRVIEKALRKDPEERYATMAEFAHDVGAIIRQLEAGDRTTKYWTPPKDPAVTARRGRTAVAVGAAALVCALSIPGYRFVRELASGSSSRTARPTHELVGEGRKLLERYDVRGNIDKAIETFRLALRTEPDAATAHAGMALALVRKNAEKADAALITDAKGHAERAVALDPQLAMARVAAAAARTATDDAAGAERELMEALKLDPGNAEALWSIGGVRFRRGDYQRAEEAYRQAVRSRPDWFEPRIALSTVYYQTGRYKEAEQENLEAVRLAPDSWRAYQMLGAMYHMQGRFEDAARAFQRSIEIRPSAPVYTNLGTIYFFRGMYEQAASVFQRAVDMQPRNPLYWGNLGDAHRWMPNKKKPADAAYERAIQLTRESLASKPENLDLRSRLALYLAKRGDSQAALAELDRVEKSTASKSVSLHYRRVVAYEAAGQRDRALGALELALRQNYSLEEVNRDPELAKLREDARFQTLIRKAAAAGRPQTAKPSP